ncbi:unnamed protein product [Durusdinium trenchii]|uniref:Uncharacterized protein n=1 Tax=Durusdinium trenchii TaxID=1381693 RepID=A0ABP0KBY1_9DINO
MSGILFSNDFPTFAQNISKHPSKTAHDRLSTRHHRSADAAPVIAGPLLPTPSRAPVNLRWPRQSRAPTPGRLRDTQADETGHPVTSIRLLEDQATAAVEDETVHFPVLSFAKASPQG